MGSKNCPETPRQKLISMMYLVLTALLALNVSVDILNAFVIVNESMEESNRIFQQRVDANYAAFERAMAENPTKVKPYQERALQVKQMADDLVEYIQGLKFEVISITEGISIEEAKNTTMRDISKKDNYDKPTTFFIGQSPDGSDGKARELKNKIIEFKTNAIMLLDEEHRSLINLGLEVEKEDFKDLSGKEMNWEMYTFYRTILAANVVLLNKLIAEVRNAESDIVSQLLTAVDEGDFKFNKIAARVVPKSRFVITGEEFEAEIFVAAYDTLQAPEVVIGSGWDSINNKVLGDVQTLEGVDGVVTYRARAGGIGRQTYGGEIRVQTPGGGVQSFPFSGEYMVAAPTATVSADKMNVFYIGVDNPISVSVPGVANENVRVSISNGRLTSTGGGKYNVRVDAGNEANINVSAEMEGQTRQMGSFKFRVRRVPDPVVYIANVSGGNVPKGNLIANPVLIPRIANFDFDLHFTVVSYTFVMAMAGNELVDRPGSGNRLTPDMISMIQGARRGQRCYIEDIRVSGPDGTRQLGTISLRII
jgi:gliding motility-associated protein GldM